MHIALPCVKIVDLPLIPYVSGGIRPHYPSIIDKAILPSSVPSRTVSFPLPSDQPFLRKMQESNHVPLTRVKEAPPSLTPMDRAHPWWLSAQQVLVESVHWFGLQPD